MSVAKGVNDTAADLGTGALSFHQILILGLPHSQQPIKFDIRMPQRRGCRGGEEYRAAHFLARLLIRLDTIHG
jgi:hypothetical protein